MKRQSSVPLSAPKRPPKQINRELPGPGSPPREVRERTDPSVFTKLATSIARTPTLNHVVGMDPIQPLVLHALPKSRLRLPHDMFHSPSKALVRSTMAHERLRDLANHWSGRIEVLHHPEARGAIQQLVKLVSTPADQGMPVHDIRQVLNTLSAILDTDPPAPPHGLPDLSAIVREYLGSEDVDEDAGLHSLARMLQGELINPQRQLDLGKFDVEVVDDFEEAEGMEVFLHARIAMEPPLETLLLGAGLDLLPAFLRQIPSLNVLVVPDYDSATIDLTGMPALHTVCFSGEVPELDRAVIPQGQMIRMVDDEGHVITLTSTPANAIAANDKAQASDSTAAARVADDLDPTDP